VPIAGILRAGHSLSEDQSVRPRGKFAGRLQDVPERILLEELPKGLTGKVDRRSLRDILIAQPDLLKQRVVARV
jgi:acyl-coenzyme A synthetase/AMP-(fatty) acid ligase